MENSWLVIRKVLGWATVVLEEVQTAMISADGSFDVVQDDVAAAQQAVERLLKYEHSALNEAATHIEYQELTRKLQAQDMPITEGEWQRAQRLDI